MRAMMGKKRYWAQAELISWDKLTKNVTVGGEQRSSLYAADQQPISTFV
jgi:hypothetical protein